MTTMSNADMARLKTVLSLASHFARNDKKKRIAPVHLFLALLTLEIVGKTNRNANDVEHEEFKGHRKANDVASDGISDLCKHLEINETGFFTDDTTAEHMFSQQSAPIPEKNELLALLQKDPLPQSKLTQRVLDCASKLTELSKGSLSYLSSLALTTFGSYDLEINKILQGAEVSQDQLAELTLQYYGQLLPYEGKVYVTVSSNISQALANNGLESLIPAIIAGLSHKEHGEDFGNALIATLILGNKMGEDCEPAEFKTNWAYRLMLGLLICNCKGITDVDSIIEQVTENTEFLKGKKAVGGLKVAITKTVKAPPFPEGENM